MPTVERLVTMANENDDINMDRVWVGALVRLDDGNCQFVSLYGKRLYDLRETRQRATVRFIASQKFDTMYREKLAHGYVVVDPTAARYGLRSRLRWLGDLLPNATIAPAVQGPRPIIRTAVVTPTERISNPQPVRISEPEPTPEPASPPATTTKPAERWIRRARTHL
jgi:hypothetical protein